jgi:hypothetical protein
MKENSTKRKLVKNREITWKKIMQEKIKSTKFWKRKK